MWNLQNMDFSKWEVGVSQECGYKVQSAPIQFYIFDDDDDSDKTDFFPI